jgi:hypothetical protein
MTGRFKRLIMGLMFLTAMTAGGFLGSPEAQAVEESDLQCWHFWWQEPQCSFCAFSCFGVEWDCCTAPIE